MAHHSPDALTPAPADWLLTVPLAERGQLAPLRDWPGLKIAFADDAAWVTGFADDPLRLPTVRAIPYITVYYQRADRLFRAGSRLPERTVPALLWSPIGRGLPVTLPPFRPNYTDPQPVRAVRLVPGGAEQPLAAMRVDVGVLRAEVEIAPAFRLEPLRWTRLGDADALVLGWPPLPVPGLAFWARANWLLPAGYDLDLPLLAHWLNEQLNPGGQHWLLWQPDGQYAAIPKAACQPLSIRSVRETLI
jgi:hypothetical protein